MTPPRPVAPRSGYLTIRANAVERRRWALAAAIAGTTMTELVRGLLDREAAALGVGVPPEAMPPTNGE